MADIDYVLAIVSMIAALFALNANRALRRELARASGLASALHESERRNELAARAAGVGLWTWHVPDDRFWASAVAQELHGVAGTGGSGGFDSLLGRADPADRARVREMLEMLTLAGPDFVVSYRIEARPGAWRWVESRGIVEREPDGRAALVRGVSMDVTDRRGAEERFRMVVEAAPSALLVVDEHGRVTLANREAESMFAADPGRLLGVPITELAIGLGPRLAAQRDRNPDAHGATRLDKGHELHARRVDGGEFLVDVGLRALAMGRGRHTLASLVDVTAQHQHERELHRLREQSANAARISLAGQLASTLAHELSQPLGAILRNAETAGILLERPDPDLAEIDAILDDIRTDDRRAGAIIDHMRSLLRGREPALCAVVLPELLSRTATLLRHDIAAHHVHVDVRAPEPMGAVLADAVQLQQVVLNLVYNALHALEQVPPSSRRLGLHARAVPEGVELVVSDTGPGVPTEALPRLFEPFYTTKSDGMGMGLAICRSLVEGMGGHIDAGNAIGGGAVFRITLQAAAVPA